MAVAPTPAALILLTRSSSVSVELSVIVVTVEPLMAWVGLAVDGGGCVRAQQVQIGGRGFVSLGDFQRATPPAVS